MAGEQTSLGLTQRVSAALIRIHRARQDPKQAETAFCLFGLEPAQERMDVTTAPERIGKCGATRRSRKPLHVREVYCSVGPMVMIWQVIAAPERSMRESAVSSALWWRSAAAT